MKFALLHIPSGKICDVQDNVCYVTFYTEEDARGYITSALGSYAQNYKPIELPATLRDHQSSAHLSAISPAARETVPAADNSGDTLPSQQPGDDDLMDDLYQHGIDSYDAREGEYLQSCRDFDAEKIEQERESEETSPAFLPFDMGHNIDDPRYQHVKCVTCGKMWQSIDFGCAAHVNFCANPLLRYAK